MVRKYPLTQHAWVKFGADSQNNMLPPHTQMCPTSRNPKIVGVLLRSCSSRNHLQFKGRTAELLGPTVKYMQPPLGGVVVACQRCRACDPGLLPGLASRR